MKSLVDNIQLSLKYERLVYNILFYNCLAKRSDPAKICNRDDWLVDIDYYHIDDMPENLKDWALELFKSNMITL